MTSLADKAFEIHPLPKIVFAPGCSGQLSQHIRLLGRQNALIVTDKGLVKAGIIAKIVDGLKADGIESIVYDGVEANPTTANVDKGSELLRGAKDAVVVPVGGGSSMDAAKGIALQGPNGGAVQDFAFGCDPAQPANPIVTIPTTAGTGSETNMFGVITDTSVGRKFYVAHPSATAAVTLLDPNLTLGLPKYVTGTCGMDVLTHSIEALTAQNTQPYSEGIALRAIEMVAQYLPQAYDEGSNLEARAQMLLASHLAGIAFTCAGLGVCHGMGHPLSARLNAPHGQTLATMLPHIMDFNMDVCMEKYAKVAAAMGVADGNAPAEANARAAIGAVERLRADVGTEKSITDLGGDEALIPTLVEDAMADMIMMTTPKFPMPDDLTRMYQAAL